MPPATNLTQAQRRGEYQRAGELAYGVIPDLEKARRDRGETRRAFSWTKR